MICNACGVSPNPNHRFCCGCGKANDTFDLSKSRVDVDLFHTQECSMGHPLLKSVQKAFPYLPFCNNCGQKLDDEEVRAIYFQCDFDYKTYEEESKRFLGLGYKVVVAAIEDYCGGMELNPFAAMDSSEPMGEDCTGCMDNAPGHGNDPVFSFMAAAIDPEQLESFRSAFKTEPYEPMFDNELTLISFRIEKINPTEEWGSLIKRLLAVPA